MNLKHTIPRILASVSTKIIVPYLILTIIVGGVGAFVVTNLATSTLQERFDNQLLDAGRIVAESMVDFEQKRLETLRTVTFTEGVAAALTVEDAELLSQLLSPIGINNDAHLISVLNTDGIEVSGWQAGGATGTHTTGSNFSTFANIQRVLEGEADEFGDKRVLLAELDGERFILTAGPVYRNDQLVGAVIVGEPLEQVVQALSTRSISRVTLYNTEGGILASSLTDDFEALQTIAESPNRYQEILSRLILAPPSYQVVVNTAANQVPLRQIEILEQTYRLAYGEWRLRNQSFGLFTVALPSNFLVRTVATSRDRLALVFSLSTVLVLTMGFTIARRILVPLERLVDVSTAVVEGNLEQRTGIQRQDEIGELANSFDLMTSFLVDRNREISAQASNLETILNSITDGVLVIDNRARVVNTNTAAKQIFQNALNLPLDKLTDYRLLYGNDELRKILTTDTKGIAVSFELDKKVYSVLSAPINDEEQGPLGRVVVMRDITRESEADRIKDSFITSVSHELRTPLTSVKGYINLLQMSGDNLTAQQSHLIHVADQNTDRLINHINHIIEITELQAGNLRVTREEMSLHKLLKDTANDWTERIGHKELKLICQVDNNPFIILGDEGRLRWALDNLFENAVYYTPTGGQLTLQAYQSDAHVFVELTDTGIGISEEDQRYLFTRFFRIDRDPPYDIRGVGLGLFAVRSLIELHKGAVWVSSKPDQGSKFSFSIPIAPA